MSARVRCRNCGSITEGGRFCQICGSTLVDPASSEIAQLRTQVNDLTRQLEKISSELREERRNRGRVEAEAERLRAALGNAEKMSRKSIDQTAAEVYEYLASHRGELDPLLCAAELRVSERDVMECLDVLQRQRKIERM